MIPHQPDVHHNVGTTLFGLGRYDDAARAFQRLVDLDPGRANGKVTAHSPTPTLRTQLS